MPSPQQVGLRASGCANAANGVTLGQALGGPGRVMTRVMTFVLDGKWCHDSAFPNFWVS